MLANLNALYPAPRPGWPSVRGGFFLGLFVAVFLLYFRPFGLRSGLYGSRQELIAFFGVLTLVASLILETLLPWLFPRLFEDKNWRVWQQIVFYLLLLLLIATLNGLFINYVGNLAFSWRNYGLIIGQTTALGILPVTMIVLFRYNAKMAYHLEQALEMTNRPASRTRSPESKPEPENPKPEATLLAAEAFGNYVKLYYSTPDGWRQEVERTTLQSIVEADPTKRLIRCHRSFAVATESILRVSGNAQGLKLSVGEGGLEIPVSRSYIPIVREAVGQ